MKKIFIFSITLLYSLLIFTTTKDYTNDIKQLLIEERQNLDYSEYDLDSYVNDNDVLPTSAPSGSNIEINSPTKIEPHLKGRFPEYTNWTYYDAYQISDVTNENPREVYEYDDRIQYGKDYAFNQLGYSYDFIGCGPLAMIGVFDYFQRVRDYAPLMTNYSGNGRTDDHAAYLDGQYRRLTSTVILNVDVIPLGSFGTATLPGDFVSGANKIIEDHNLSQQISVSSKLYTSQETRVTKIKEHVEAGMPVVWWTGPNDGFFTNHYVNIYGYETWTALDENGDPIIHTMFLLRLNWGRAQGSTIYADEDALKGIGGLIFFEESYETVTIYPETFSTLQQQYFYTEQVASFQTTHPYKTAINFQTNRLRTGYINSTGITEQGDWFLTMSAKRENAGEAYMEFTFVKKIYGINIDLSLWSSLEGISSNNASVTLEIRVNGVWTTVHEFLSDSSFSKTRHLPSNHIFIFEDETEIEFVTNFRFRVVAPATGTSANHGRVVISNMFLLYEDF